MKVLSTERASADTSDGGVVGATVLRIVLPDPEAAALIAATTDSATTNRATVRVRPMSNLGRQLVGIELVRASVSIGFTSPFAAS